MTPDTPNSPKLPSDTSLGAAWRRVPARLRGLTTSVLAGVALAMLTALQLQLATGHVNWPAVLLAGETATVAGAIQFIHGLRLPQEK